MQVQIFTHWKGTSWYDSGERLFKFEWNNATIPSMNQTIKMHEIIKNRFEITEHFKYNGETHNIFEWIDKEHHWSIVHLEWRNENLVHIIVNDQ